MSTAALRVRTSSKRMPRGEWCIPQIANVVARNTPVQAVCGRAKKKNELRRSPARGKGLRSLSCSASSISVCSTYWSLGRTARQTCYYVGTPLRPSIHQAKVRAAIYDNFSAPAEGETQGTGQRIRNLYSTIYSSYFQLAHLSAGALRLVWNDHDHIYIDAAFFVLPVAAIIRPLRLLLSLCHYRVHIYIYIRVVVLCYYCYFFNVCMLYALCSR